MRKLVDVAKAPKADKMTTARERVKDVRAARYPAAGAEGEARKLVRAAVETNVQDASQVELHLARSEAAMQEVIEDLREALDSVRKRSEDEWITRDAHAKVVFRDVSKSNTAQPELKHEDSTAVARLRETFHRVKSRRAKQLSDSGHEIDLEAYIANKMNNTLGPVFKQEATNRGFKALVLVDRSSSMQGERTSAVERATRILRNALKQPNVEFHVWGFQSLNSDVVLTRVAPTVDMNCKDPEMKVVGTTPLHVAVRTAVNWLGSGSEKKQLIILTDGNPCFTSSSGKSFSDAQLKDMVSKEVVRARKQGINVTSLVVGTDVSDKDARTMFGERKYWGRIADGSERTKLTKHLVNVVSTSFLQYLSNR